MAKRKGSSKEKLNGPLVKTKRPRLQLNDLPMDILHSIVSRVPIREAVRTSILSKHWKHIWSYRTNLKFSFKSLVHKRGSGIPRSFISENVFIQRVNAVLKQLSGIGVDKMEIQFSPLDNEHAEHIDRWVQFAIASKTKQFILDFEVQHPTKEPYSFPFHLFDATSGSHLQSIKLGSVSVKDPANIKFFLNLKRLELVDVNITDAELKLMLLNCNALEFFGISRCKTLTSLQTRRPFNHFKHLLVSHCPLLQEIQLHFGLVTLEYEGPLLPLSPPSTLRNLSIKSSDNNSVLSYIFTKLPSTLPRLEMLTLRCQELKSATLPKKPIKFLYLRHVRLELNYVPLEKRNTDVLDLAFLLEAAPVMEKFEVHMWMDYQLQRYHKCHGELRSFPSHPHSHLKFVDITGFYGQKDQLELALHILKNSTVLKAMKIDPKPTVAAINCFLSLGDGPSFLDGYKVAKKYLRGADQCGVINVTKVCRRDIQNGCPYKLIDPIWLAMAEDE